MAPLKCSTSVLANACVKKLAETGRVVRNQEITESSLSAFTQAIVFLKRYVDFAVNGEAIAPSLLIPTY